MSDLKVRNYCHRSLFFLTMLICFIDMMLYFHHCISRNFWENFIFANIIKRHICDAVNLQLGPNLHISVNDIVISAGGFYFHETSHMRSFAKIKPSRKFTNLQYVYGYQCLILR